ncbi:S8 family serine peptidase, partial [Candidatus Woesearchaeota archaeon]|nr:S8 family serine peptidase [Candidatus Woesearchaeota archaeon]
MKGGLLIFLFVLAYSISVRSQINSEVQDLFGDNEEVDVIVVLKDDYNVLQQYEIGNYKDKDNFEMKKMMINEQQEHVLNDLKLKEKKQEEDKVIASQAIKAKAIAKSQTLEDYDFELTNTYATVNGFTGKLKKSSYEKMKNNPNVAGIYKPKEISILLSDSAGIINATRVWSLIYNETNITGKGESVCVIDTGVDYTHPALGNCSTATFTNGTCQKVMGGYDFVNNDNDSIDDHGHGTHVAGIVASINDTIRGIAPDANIVSIKVLDASGNGNSSNLISGIDWCVNNASKFNISVISMSLGTSVLFTSHCDNDDPLLTSSIANAIAKNISVIAATGNADSPTGIASPACITNVTSVGGVTKADAMDFNRNNITDLLAPGVNILSTKKGGGFESLSGTSMAAPHVAGAFALLHQYRRLEQNIILTPDQIQDALNDT